jgi:hypothetical protein
MVSHGLLPLKERQPSSAKLTPDRMACCVAVALQAGPIRGVSFGAGSSCPRQSAVLTRQAWPNLQLTPSCWSAGG